ncbi:hypothetical protein CYMTET_40276 [Cymbomonas tetramitiformis]|uniref:Uncharacterized protein n=1 Tax=Cymbomonas tetramitiformis TaxID=36881 RepID=A0AAE0C8C6_9CHLO|nr:hypothetical protein CYMTET_40276 [Cymbomonas tetramitiformis]
MELGVLMSALMRTTGSRPAVLARGECAWEPDCGEDVGVGEADAARAERSTSPRLRRLADAMAGRGVNAG